ncbi:MAG TPA: alpha/beta hydrolase [Caulobacterales bacterium]|nr:alpha/beta hydrolase [Caulobacterales bacterium]
MAFVRVPGNEIPDGAEEHWLEGRGGVRLRVLTAPAHGAPRGAVIVAPGRTEFIEKYFEVARELQGRGFAVFCIDWRGQGLSGRETNNPLKGHFASFDDPVNDLATALRLLAAKLPRPHIALAHSMGGAIVLRALQTRRVDFDAAVITAPMWGIQGLGDLAKNYVRFVASLGLGANFAPGVETRWKRENFKRNPVTHDKERHARTQGLIAEEPALALAGPTVGWVAAASEMIDGFLQPNALAHIRTPVLVFSAGQEQLVDLKSHEAIAKLLPNSKLIILADAKHEILMETDDIRAQFWAGFDSFVEQVAPRRAA